MYFRYFQYPPGVILFRKMISKSRIPLVLQCLLLVIPLNIYVIGDWLAQGIQWALFRYQQSYLGNSLIPVNRDLYYVTSGILTGTSAASIILWMAGVTLLIIALVLMVRAIVSENPVSLKQGALCTIAAGITFGISQLLQYGILLHGERGFAIPIGVPVILVTGWWVYREDFGLASGEDDMEKTGEGEEE
jgi:hypothetical protein